VSAGDAATLIFEVGGMHCPSCGLLIDEVVEELPGVVSSATDVRAGRTVVRLTDDSTLDPSTVMDAIAELRYTAALYYRDQR
jgi:copper chaperone